MKARVQTLNMLEPAGERRAVSPEPGRSIARFAPADAPEPQGPRGRLGARGRDRRSRHDIDGHPPSVATQGGVRPEVLAASVGVGPDPIGRVPRRRASVGEIIGAPAATPEPKTTMPPLGHRAHRNADGPEAGLTSHGTEVDRRHILESRVRHASLRSRFTMHVSLVFGAGGFSDLIGLLTRCVPLELELPSNSNGEVERHSGKRSARLWRRCAVRLA